MTFASFEMFRALVAPLPKLVRQQRRLAKQIASIGNAIEDDKALRKEIDKLLGEAGLNCNQGVACLGYDVVRRGQKGRSSVNTDVLVEKLVAAGVARKIVVQAITQSTDPGTPSSWAEVKPSPGASVRAVA